MVTVTGSPSMLLLLWVETPSEAPAGAVKVRNCEGEDVRQGELDNPNGPGPNGPDTEGPLPPPVIEPVADCPGLPESCPEATPVLDGQGYDGVISTTPVLQVVWPGSRGRV